MVTAAFDADIVNYAAAGDDRGDLLLDAIHDAAADSPAGVGSTLLLTETLTLAGDRLAERPRLLAILGRLALLPVTHDVAVMAAALRVRHRLKTPDALHLATAISAGADRFVTNNRHDFARGITEIDVVHP
ncbi:type II toxin-antitoxin system VapC family toxin [Mumia zhuanghuii]|uniref:type II toxin-antitoxin system VapC family toxin n=1 Tax=Mumia zhuanghuii TaxID=2585211 RepID=UPI003624EAB6